MALVPSHALTLGDVAVRQLDGLFSLNDLHRAAGGAARHKPSEWLRTQQAQQLLAEISKAGIPAIASKPKVGTYACRELVIAYAAWISPAFHLRVIRVFLAVSAPSAAPALPDPARTQAAFDAAARAGAAVQAAVFDAVLAGGEQWKQGRWLLSFIDDSAKGAPACVQPLEPDAFAASWARLVHDTASGARPRSSADLAGMVDACLCVLARRQARERGQPAPAHAQLDALPAQVRPLFNQALARLCADAHAHITPWALQRLAHGCNLDHPANLEQRARALLDELRFEDWLSQGEAAQARALVRFFEIGGQLAAESLARLQARQQDAPAP